MLFNVFKILTRLASFCTSADCRTRQQYILSFSTWLCNSVASSHYLRPADAMDELGILFVLFLVHPQRLLPLLHHHRHGTHLAGMKCSANSKPMNSIPNIRGAKNPQTGQVPL